MSSRSSSTRVGATLVLGIILHGCAVYDTSLLLPAPAGLIGGATSHAGTAGTAGEIQGGDAGAAQGGDAGAPDGGTAGTTDAGAGGADAGSSGTSGVAGMGHPGGTNALGGFHNGGAGGAQNYDIYPPFVVEEYGFAPGQNNGTWGNWATLVAGTCSQRAPGTPRGICNNWKYIYNANSGANCGGSPISPPATPCIWTTMAWKLVTGVTKTISPGANFIEFYAWGSGAVTFSGAGQGNLQVTLTATPTQYRVPITKSYANTDNAFTITFQSVDSGTVVNVDDIRWRP